MIQLALAFFGLSALWMATGRNERAPGAGRKPLPGGAVSVNLTLTPAHRDQLKALGGSAWVRKMLDAVRAVEKKD